MEDFLQMCGAAVLIAAIGFFFLLLSEIDK